MMEVNTLIQPAIHMIDTIVSDEYSRILSLRNDHLLDDSTVQKLMPFRSVLCKHYDQGFKDSILKTYIYDIEEWIKRVVANLDITGPLDIYKNAMYIYELAMDIIYKKYNYTKLIKHMVKHDMPGLVQSIAYMILGIKDSIASLLKQCIIQGGVVEINGVELLNDLSMINARDCMLDGKIIPYISSFAMVIDKHYNITAPVGIHAMTMKVYTYIIIAFFMRDGFAEDIAMAAYSPKRVQYLIDNYNYDCIHDM